MKIEKNFRKDFDNRIKQLCEDFCDQADERKFLTVWLSQDEAGPKWAVFYGSPEVVLNKSGGSGREWSGEGVIVR